MANNPFLIISFVVKVDLVRTYKFRNSDRSYTGVPVIAANMDTVGTWEMAKALLKVIAITINLNPVREPSQSNHETRLDRCLTISGLDCRYLISFQ